MLVNREDVIDRICALVEASGHTYTEIAAQCGVDARTIQRNLNPNAKSPSFELLCDIIVFCGGSVDDVIGLEHQGDRIITVANEPLEAQLRAEACRERRRAERAERTKSLLIAFFIVVLLVVIIDLLNPNVGWIRYILTPQASAFSENTAAVILCFPWRLP